jgi:hypothetical protein
MPSPKSPQDNTQFKSIVSGIDEESIKRVIVSHLDEIEKCYKDSLIYSSSHEGRVVYKWSLNNTGDVKDITILSSNISNTDLELCVKQRIITWNFDKPETNEAEIIYPFVFEAVKR